MDATIIQQPDKLQYIFENSGCLHITTAIHFDTIAVKGITESVTHTPSWRLTALQKLLRFIVSSFSEEGLPCLVIHNDEEPFMIYPPTKNPIDHPIEYSLEQEKRNEVTVPSNRISRVSLNIPPYSTLSLTILI